ncbi:MAG: HAD hydrolase-like protein [Deltaproteobacteria bacterium]|nr:HAD hydrolase-like protein [Deltaproteobacteria bacterium]
MKGNGSPLAGVRHLIWDWNGTLLDDAWLCVEVMNGLLSRRGLPPLSLERYQEVFAFPVKDYYVGLGFDFAAEPWEAVGTEFIEGYEAGQRGCQLQPGAREVLEAIAGRGIGQSVLSASQRTRLHRQARDHAIDHHFSELLGLDDHYAGGKIEIGRDWLDETGIDPATTLLVGDTDHDLEVAEALGLRCYLVPSGHQSAGRLAAHGAPLLSSLSGLLA